MSGTATAHRGVEPPAPAGAGAAPIDAGTVRRRHVAGVATLLGTCVVTVLLSLALGAKSIPLGIVVDAFTDFDPADGDHLIVRELRLPRTIVGLLTGAALGVSGALMQAITRNPLADPGILGVNAGASFAVVLAIWLFGISSVLGLVWFAFVGAAVASVVVYLLGTAGRGGPTPVRLALAGAALSALLFALTRAVTLLDQATLDQFRFWAVGSLSGRGADVAKQTAVFIAAGLGIAVLLSRPLNALALGEEAAAALGIRVNALRVATATAIMLLCGAAVAAAGPVGFVGLVVPHAARTWFGPDQRWLLPACALGGPALLLACDALGRIVARPGEVQVGIMTAAVGGPAFVLLVRRVRVIRL